MHCPTLEALPFVGGKRKGWPWSHSSEPQTNGLISEKVTYPKISIITPSFNQGRYIEETIRSVLLQGYPNIEFIIIDGGSTDNTVEIIKKYENWIKFWLSEPDNGQANAINKGIRYVTGDVLGWINSDDYYAPNVFNVVGREYSKNQSIIAGNVIEVDSKAKPLRRVVQRNISYRNVIEFWKNNRCTWHQPGIFYPIGEVDERIGLDESLNYEMDRDFLIKYLSRFSVIYIGMPFAFFRLHEDSKSVNELNRFYIERSQVSQKYWQRIDGSSGELRKRGLTRYLIKKASHQFRHGQVGDSFQMLLESYAIDPKFTIISIMKEIIRLLKGGRFTGNT